MLDKKYFNSKALDVDDKTKRVKIGIAELESIDKDEDLFLPTAFDVTIKQRGPQGSNEIWHLLDHDKVSFSALSKFSEINREGNLIAGVSKYKNSFAWREVAWPLYAAGDFTQHSVGFVTVQQEKQEGYNLIKEVTLYEGSAVLWGANPNTPTMQVVKSLLNTKEDRDITAQEKIQEIIVRIKKDKFSDDNAEVLLIELMRLQKMLDSDPLHKIIIDEQEKASQPAITAVDPVADKSNEVLLFSHLLINKIGI